MLEDSEWSAENLAKCETREAEVYEIVAAHALLNGRRLKPSSTTSSTSLKEDPMYASICEEPENSSPRFNPTVRKSTKPTLVSGIKKGSYRKHKTSALTQARSIASSATVPVINEMIKKNLLLKRTMKDLADIKKTFTSIPDSCSLKGGCYIVRSKKELLTETKETDTEPLETEQLVAEQLITGPDFPDDSVIDVSLDKTDLPPIVVPSLALSPRFSAKGKMYRRTAKKSVSQPELETDRTIDQISITEPTPTSSQSSAPAIVEMYPPMFSREDIDAIIKYISLYVQKPYDVSVLFQIFEPKFRGYDTGELKRLLISFVMTAKMIAMESLKVTSESVSTEPSGFSNTFVTDLLASVDTFHPLMRRGLPTSM